MSEPSLDATQELIKLFVMPRDRRDADWVRNFFELIPNAALVMPEQQVLQGPDQFGYFVLNTPTSGEPFSAVTVGDVTEHCLEQGLGLVINPGKGQPDWVFTFGSLWSKKQFDLYDTTPLAQTTAEDPSATQMTLGAPTDDVMPPFARSVMRHFFHGRLGVELPGVILIHNPAQAPSQALVFNLYREDFPDDEQFGQVMHFVRWYLPNHYAVATVPKDSPVQQNFFAL